MYIFIQGLRQWVGTSYYTNTNSKKLLILLIHQRWLSHIIRKLAFLMCENTGADQLHSNHATDCYVAITIPLFLKSEWLYSQGYVGSAHKY